MTVREIAKLCNVSPATVSRVANGNAPVNPETRLKIEAAIQQHGYTPKPRPRPRHAQSNLIGVLLPSISHIFFQRVLEEINTGLASFGKSLVILPDDWENPTKKLQHLPLEGLILLHEEIDSHTILALTRQSIPMVMCGALSLSKSFAAVHVDDLAAAYDGTNYLLSLGHRNIGVISDSPYSISSGFQRVAGTRKAMEDSQIHLPEELVVAGGTNYEAGYKAAQQLIRQQPNITAVFAHSDSSAWGAINAFTDMGISVPNDISVMGFDDTELGELVRPKLTCVHQPIHHIVQKCIQLLLEEIQNPGSVAASSITLPHRIVVRQSCRNLTA